LAGVVAAWLGFESMELSYVLLSQPEFKLFGVAHCLAMLVTVCLAIGLTRFARSKPDEKILKRLRYTMAGLLVMAVALDPILTLRRYGMGEFGWGLVVDSALPLYLCDVVSVFLAYALVTKSQRVTEIGYLWGCAGTVQGLITPTLWFDASTVEFYIFFLQHGGVPVAAVFLVWGLKIVPKKGAWVRALYWSWGYMAIVMAINWMIGKNYGFLNGLPEVHTLFAYMGPYPFTLITLQAIAFLLYFILLKIAPGAECGGIKEVEAHAENVRIEQ
jgi:hypothetical integral membrane protein (TIGR02206 family)